MNRFGLVAAAFAATIAIGAPASASLLNLVLEDHPDIFSDFIDVTYDAGTDSLLASGFALTYDDDGVGLHNITSGTFDLSATVDDFGIASSGLLTITGSVLGFGPTLLTGSLFDFGFADGGGMILEFLFQVTGGDLAADYGGNGAAFGVILDLNSGSYSGDWTQSFDNLQGGPGTGSGSSDTAPQVPGPSALALMFAAGVLARRRRRRDDPLT